MASVITVSQEFLLQYKLKGAWNPFSTHLVKSEQSLEVLQMGLMDMIWVNWV